MSQRALPMICALEAMASLVLTMACQSPGVAIPAPNGATMPASTSRAVSTSRSADKANADVLHVRAVQGADSTWTFYVAVAHPDTGWEDYADGWDVVLPDGTAVKPDPDSPFTRLLLHPHENEQPFTRSQSGILIPASMTQVRVRAHDLVDGFGGAEIVVRLEVLSGPGFEVVRRKAEP